MLHSQISQLYTPTNTVTTVNRSSDIVIAVMGVTGSGKSTFISQLVDQEVPVGHGLRSSMCASFASITDT